MTHKQFERLVGRLEADARRAPRSYRMRVLALAMLGYAYVGVVLLVLLALLGGLGWLATLGKGMGLVVKGHHQLTPRYSSGRARSTRLRQQGVQDSPKC